MIFSFIYSRSNLSYQLIKCTISPPPPLPLYDLLYLLLSSSQPNSIYLYIQIWGFSQNFTIPFFKLYTEIQPTESINVSNNQNKLSLICPTVNKKKKENFFRTVFQDLCNNTPFVSVLHICDKKRNSNFRYRISCFFTFHNQEMDNRNKI